MLGPSPVILPAEVWSHTDGTRRRSGTWAQPCLPVVAAGSTASHGCECQQLSVLPSPGDQAFHVAHWNRFWSSHALSLLYPIPWKQTNKKTKKTINMLTRISNHNFWTTYILYQSWRVPFFINHNNNHRNVKVTILVHTLKEQKTRYNHIKCHPTESGAVNKLIPWQEIYRIISQTRLESSVTW